MTTEVFILKKEVKILNEQLYKQYKRTKELKEQVDYLKDKLSVAEAKLEEFSERKLNAN
tara:strand:- start:487 stop:663 length:177 start_codon:yes stop_codon:yes gene_type:complete